MRALEKAILGVIFVVLVGFISYGIVDLTKEVQSQPAINVQDQQLRALGWCKYTGYQSLTPNSTTASILTQTSMGVNTTIAWITAETANMRYWMDGTSPTTAVGHIIGAGGTLTLKGRHQINNFKIISASTHGTIRVSYGE